MNWRTDTENCPKDKPFLVIHPSWNHRDVSKETYKVVEYTANDKSLSHNHKNQKWGYAYK